MLFLYSFVGYLILTINPSNDLLLWQTGEVILAFLIAIITAIICAQLLEEINGFEFLLQPKKLLTFLVFLGPFFFRIAEANFDVAYRVITGKINPGIVKIETDFDKDTSVTMLANSITLTPGTLTVDEDDGDLFVHWINYKEPYSVHDVIGSFREWARRTFE
ncbi:cation:proton antiporter [archaeon SCG-AAA382B04]|nr:cation:proton antiporter [archaeon SCG-AAA382B04]